MGSFQETFNEVIRLLDFLTNEELKLIKNLCEEVALDPYHSKRGNITVYTGADVVHIRDTVKNCDMSIYKDDIFSTSRIYFRATIDYCIIKHSDVDSFTISTITGSRTGHFPELAKYFTWIY
jgi:hypothetical protein